MTQLSSAERLAILDWVSLTPSEGRAVGHDVSWDRILELVGRSLAPLVLRGMGERAAAVAPPAVLDVLRARRDQVARQRLLVVATLHATSRALAAAAVPFIVLKGGALASLVYPEPVLRPMSDIDLWVPPDRFADALDALSSLGFRDIVQLDLAAPAALEPGHRRLANGGPSLDVEVHAHLASLDGVPWATFATAWEAGLDADLGGIRARVLGPEHQLTHVCLHLARRNVFTTGLSHLVDVARIVRQWQGTWDWPRLVRDWRDQRVAAWVLLALVLSRDLLGAPVPHDIEAGVAGPDWSVMLALAQAQLWEGRAHQVPNAVERSTRHRTLAERLRWLRWRLTGHYWHSPEPRPAGRVIADGLQRIWHDVSVKVPGYLRGWLGGRLRGAALAEGLTLARQRFELERMVAASGGLGRGPAWDPPVPGTGADVATGSQER